jgi:hypothetical protein
MVVSAMSESDILTPAEVAEYLGNFGPKVDLLANSHEHLRESLRPLEDSLAEARQQAATALEHWHREAEFLRERLVISESTASVHEKALKRIARTSGVNEKNWFERMSEMCELADQALAISLAEGDMNTKESAILEFSSALSAIRAGLNCGPAPPTATDAQIATMNEAWVATQEIFALAERAHAAERRNDDLGSDLVNALANLSQAVADREEIEQRMDDETIEHGLTEERADAAEAKLADMTRWYETVLAERDEARRRLIEGPQEKALLTAHEQVLARAESAEAELVRAQGQLGLYEETLALLASEPKDPPSTEEATLALIEVQQIAAQALRDGKK